MPGPHPRYRRASGLLDGMRVLDWAPPGWHWEVVSGVRRLARNPGLVVDPIFFGGGHVVHSRCGGSRPPRRLYDDVSGRRTTTFVATWRRWTTPGTTVYGSYFRDLTLATSG